MARFKEVKKKMADDLSTITVPVSNAEETDRKAVI